MRSVNLKRYLILAANVLVAAYFLSLLIYFVNGPTTFELPGRKLRLNDLFTLGAGFFISLSLRLALAVTWGKRAVFAAAAIGASTIFTLAASELALRILYPLEMTPPPYTYNAGAKYSENNRGPYSGGPKGPEVKRIVIQGDSITWGAAVPDWKDLYPYKLDALLRQSGKKYDMQVWAAPGMQVDFHAKNLAFMGEEMAPDVIIYQWYVNDVEVWAGRPAVYVPWRKGPVHPWLEGKSLMYRLVESRLGALLYREGEKYAEYLNGQIIPGKKYWWYFELEFHKWATLANSLAGRTIMLVYPSLPFKGEYPFAKVTDSVLSLLHPHEMKIPATYLFKREGEDEAGLGSTYETARTARMGRAKKGHILFGPYIPLAQGAHEAGFVMKLLSPAPAGTAAALLEITSGQGGKLLASRRVSAEDLGQPGQWKKIILSFNVEEKLAGDVEFRVEYLGGCDLAVDTIDVPVDYKIEAAYPMEELMKFNTHARIFDAHPNPRAHSVLAKTLADLLLKEP